MPPPKPKKDIDSCWTCRLRRKRCTLERPVCGNCHSLQIVCHFGIEKPIWMINDAEKRNMVKRVKDEIKQGAFRRRERRNVRSSDQEMVLVLEGNSSTPTEYSPNTMDPVLNGTEADRSIASATSTGLANLTPVSDSPATIPDRTNPNPSRDVELGFIMIYLDYVFPYLFPFYRPSLLETGRHWVLSLLFQNEVSLSTAASLSAYFFSIALQDGYRPMQDACRAVVRTKLMEKVDLAVEKIQQDISQIARRGRDVTIMESSRVLGEVIQLFVMEVMVKEDVDWSIHLSPAISLFTDILEAFSTSASPPDLGMLLRQMPLPSGVEDLPNDKPLPNTADQSAFLFFTAVVVFIDIISSTALDQPRLQHYHTILLSHAHEIEYPAPHLLELERFIGCPNWVLLAISDVSTLSSWKKSAQNLGNSSTTELNNRFTSISQSLEKGLRDLDRRNPKVDGMEASPNHLANYYSRPALEFTASLEPVARIWAHAAKIYLSVVTSGWHPTSPEVQNSVVKDLALLRDIKNPAQLRSMAWPLCVAGCLALPCQEQGFRDIVGSMGDLGVFGTIDQAGRIMEEIWRRRDGLGEGWDIAACLGILGCPALLI